MRTNSIENQQDLVQLNKSHCVVTNAGTAQQGFDASKGNK